MSISSLTNSNQTGSSEKNTHCQLCKCRYKCNCRYNTRIISALYLHYNWFSQRTAGDKASKQESRWPKMHLVVLHWTALGFTALHTDHLHLHSKATPVQMTRWRKCANQRAGAKIECNGSFLLAPAVSRLHCYVIVEPHTGAIIAAAAPNLFHNKYTNTQIQN